MAPIDPLLLVPARLGPPFRLSETVHERSYLLVARARGKPPRQFGKLQTRREFVQQPNRAAIQRAVVLSASSASSSTPSATSINGTFSCSVVPCRLSSSGALFLIVVIDEPSKYVSPDTELTARVPGRQRDTERGRAMREAPQSQTLPYGQPRYRAHGFSVEFFPHDVKPLKRRNYRIVFRGAATRQAEL